MTTRKQFHLGGALCLGAAFFVLVLEIYARNVGEFIGEASLFAVPALAAAFLTSLAIALSIASRFQPFALIVIQVTTVGIIAAGYVFAISAPPLDGGEHIFAVDLTKAVIELFIFALIITSTAILARRHMNLLFAAVSLLIIATGSIHLSTIIMRPDTKETPADTPPDLLAPLLALSDELNILHVMFDSLQSDAFEQILTDNPDLRAAFDGFTYYADHAGYSNWTNLSLPALQAGRQFFDIHRDNAGAIEEIAGWLRLDSIMASLAEQGYAANAVQPSEAFCFNMPFYCTTLPRLSADIAKRVGRSPVGSDPLILIDLALLRLTPTLFKPYVYNNGGLLLSSVTGARSPIERDIILSADFARILSNGMHVSATQPVYKFLHFYPPHKPFILDRDCQPGQRRNEIWQNYIPQATCSVRLITKLLQRIKKLGAYDNTIIVIEADTGLGMVQDPDPNAQSVTSVISYTRRQLVGYARPTFAIKGLKSRGPLTTSKRPTSHLSTFRLIEEASAGRVDLEDIDDTEPRRFVVSDIVRDDTTNVAPYESFTINGAVTDFASWEADGIFLKDGVKVEGPAPVESAILEVDGTIPAKVGETLRLEASSVGGREKEYLFFRRMAVDQFDVIQDWSGSRSALWEVKAGGRQPCFAELLLAVRNKAKLIEEQTLTLEKDIPIDGPECR